jgi:hypothetical protein
MLLALTAIASVSLGYDLSRFIWREDRDRLWWAERALYGSLIGVALWLATTWALAFAQLLTRPAIIGRTLVFLIVAIALRVRAGGFREMTQRQLEPRTVYLAGLPLLPLFLWCIFILWRSAIVPPLSHDALSSHLPRAALWVQAQGYDSLAEWADLITVRPSSYEMMVADAIVLDGDDTYTEWLSTIFYVLFILASVALVQRWWGATDLVTTIVTALLVAAVPVALLQSGAHKNDLMTAYFLVAGAVAAGRAITAADLRALVLAGVAFSASAGTKQHGPILFLTLAPFLLASLVRMRWNVRRIAAVVVIAALSVALLGVGAYALDRRAASAWRQPPPAAVSSAAASPEAGESSSRYGDWANLWIGPWALVTAPFSYGRALFVPGYGSWYWQRYEIYFSHLGVHFAIALLLFVFGVLRYRRAGPDETRRERTIVTIAMVAAFFAILPIRGTPFGMFMMTLPRFVLFIVPVVLGWTIVPLLRDLAERGNEKLVLTAAALCFSFHAIDCALEDAFVPIRYVAWARQNPGTRVIPFSQNRPASIVDRIAGPEDVIAIDAGASAWVYPAFGRKLTRRLILLPPDPAAPIPDEAKWVIIDRSWSVIWGDPRFRSLSDSDKYLRRGEPAPADRAALARLENDPRFEFVAISPRTLQGVFVRRGVMIRRPGTPPSSVPRSDAR